MDFTQSDKRVTAVDAKMAAQYVDLVAAEAISVQECLPLSTKTVRYRKHQISLYGQFYERPKERRCT